jgi:IstB-like ATP binding protein
MSTAIAKNLMAEMKPLGMFAAFDQCVVDATRDQTSYSGFIDMLLQAESDCRQKRKTGYRIKPPKFTLRPAFEDIDFTRQPFDQQSANQGAVWSSVGDRGAPGAADRSNRRRQDLHRAGHEASCLCLRQIRSLHDRHDLA